MNVISYSLYSNNPKYWKSLLLNLQIATEVYPGWQVRVYTATDVEKEIVEQLERGGASVIMYNALPGHKGMFQRFRPFWDDNVTRTIVRDADDALGYTDRKTVDMWIESEKQFYTLAAHQGHNKRPVYCCLFGMTNRWDRHLLDFPDLNNISDKYGTDEQWIADNLVPLIKDSWLRLRTPKATPEGYGGERILVENQPIPQDSIIRQLDLSCIKYKYVIGII